MSTTLRLTFAPPALRMIAAFTGFSLDQSLEVQAVEREAANLLVQGIRGSMHWKSGTDGSGPLGQSILAHSTGVPGEVEVGSALPYARRRDVGFVGADSLGRVYDDAGAYYMEAGMAAMEEPIRALYGLALQKTLHRLSGE